MGRKWNNIKEKKAAADKKRGQSYSKVVAEIMIAAKAGSDPNSNFRLKLALQKARDFNVPRDNVERAIAKGSGEGGQNILEVNYEGYGVDGVAIFVEATTDNVTRTVANVRSTLVKYGGSLGKEGCLQFVFERKAVFEIPKASIDVDELTMELIDVGAEDVVEEDGYITVKGEVENFGAISKKLEELSIKPETAELERLPLNYKKVSQESFEKIMKMIGILEDDDDVQTVYHNIEYDEAFEA
jgi:YebC/PmpR family DNA-binding regulatory protein